MVDTDVSVVSCARGHLRLCNAVRMYFSQRALKRIRQHPFTNEHAMSGALLDAVVAGHCAAFYLQWRTDIFQI